MMLFCESTVIGKQAFERPVLVFILSYATVVGVRDVEAVHTLSGEITALVGAIVQTDGLLEGQSLDPGSAEFDVAGIIGPESEAFADPLVRDILDILARREPDVVQRHAGAYEVGAVGRCGAQYRGKLEDTVQADLVAVTPIVIGIGGETYLEPVA